MTGRRDLAETHTGSLGLPGRCDCGKVRFLSKRDAKKTISRMTSRSGGRLHAYRCKGNWHIGHVPSALKHGVIARDEVTPRPGGRR